MVIFVTNHDFIYEVCFFLIQNEVCGDIGVHTQNAVQLVRLDYGKDFGPVLILEMADAMVRQILLKYVKVLRIYAEVSTFKEFYNPPSICCRLVMTYEHRSTGNTRAILLEMKIKNGNLKWKQTISREHFLCVLSSDNDNLR